MANGWETWARGHGSLPWQQDRSWANMLGTANAARRTDMQAQRQADIASGQDPYQLANGQLRNPDGRPTYGIGVNVPTGTDPTIMGVQGNGMTPTPTMPQVMPGVSTAQGYTGGSPVSSSSGTANSAPYTPPAPAAGSATATNPFLNLGLNAFTNTQQGFDSQWYDNLAKSLWGQANQNYLDNLAPSLDSSAIAAGGYGGDRAALAKGVVMDRMNQNVLNSLAPVYASGYENSLTRALQGGQSAAGVGQGLEQLDLQRLLGMGSLGVQQQNADTNTAQVAANSAGVPSYSNPLAAGLGGALTLWKLLGLEG